VRCGGAFLTLLDLKLDALPFRQTAISIPLNGGEMHKHIAATIVAGDEPITLLIAEPLDGSGFNLAHLKTSFCLPDVVDVAPPALTKNRPGLTSLGGTYIVRYRTCSILTHYTIPSIGNHVKPLWLHFCSLYLKNSPLALKISNALALAGFKNTSG
jgi:hypothetical protein